MSDGTKGIEGRAGTGHRRRELSRASGPKESNISNQTRRRANPRLHGDSCEVPGDSVIQVTSQETIGSHQEIMGPRT